MESAGVIAGYSCLHLPLKIVVSHHGTNVEIDCKTSIILTIIIVDIYCYSHILL